VRGAGWKSTGTLFGRSQKNPASEATGKAYVKQKQQVSFRFAEIASRRQFIVYSFSSLQVIFQGR
jgi:hypothetical protein